MSNVIPFSAALRRNPTEEDKRRRQEIEDAGSHAWGRLLKARKLSKPDRVALARALYDEFKTLREKDTTLRAGEFAVIAELSRDRTSRELHKYMLPPADEAHSREKQQRDLRASAEGYRNFIKAIQRKTGENIAILADRVTWATSFHPRQAKDVEESEKLLSRLQEAINKIDKSFPEVSGQAKTLYEVFKLTAEAKVEMRKNGSLLRWSYYNADVPYDNESLDDYAQHYPYGRLKDEIEVRYAYWGRDFEGYRNDGHYSYGSELSYSSELSPHKTIINLPRIYLGLIIDWATDGPYDSARKTSFLEYLRKHIGEIAEKRDETTNLARLVYCDPKTGECTDIVWPSPIDTAYHAWLIIYPSPDNRSLVPVIYRPHDEAGVQLIHLSHRNFLKLKDFEFITVDGPIISLYDKIKQLMGFGTGHFKIEEEWKATAPDVILNPVLLAHQEKEQREQAFERQFENWWHAGTDGA